MPNIISKLKQQVSSGTSAVPVCGHGANPKNNYRYRQQRGVNLGKYGFVNLDLLKANVFKKKGSWFVLERWITEEPFRCAKEPAQSDLDVAQGTEAKEILEHHWDTWIQESDWEWIEDLGINTVRIPVSSQCGEDAFYKPASWFVLDWILSYLRCGPSCAA